METPQTTRWTLRDLPIAAKLVLSVFLISVGLGYFSALVQLHSKHSKKEGEPMPTPADVVEVFAGLKEYDPNAPTECCRIESLILGDPNAANISKDNMAPAFFAKSKGWQKLTEKRGVNLEQIRRERQGEINAMLAWLHTDAATRQSTYIADDFLLDAAQFKDQPISADFVNGTSLKIQSLFNARCQNCHKDQTPSLGTFAELEQFVTPPSTEVIDGKWVRSSRQTSIETLTQSTHAHLLSFSVLFACTGLVFAFTSFPSIIRCVLGPIVLIAQIADISCWWLARVPDYGPYFAYAILGTGSIVGLGLAAQIVLSLWNMYGTKGKVGVVVTLALGAAVVGIVGLKVIQPALDEERAAALAAKTPVIEPEVKQPEVPAATEKISALERLIMGPREGAKFNGSGSMAPAFFEKDADDYKDLIEERPKAEVDAERDGERLALQAWIRLAEATRQETYENDAMTLPSEREGQPLTPRYLDGKMVKVQSILNDRCGRCHWEGEEQEDYPLQNYAQLLKYLTPEEPK